MDKRRFTDTVLTVRPKHFGYNEETAMNNRFQQEVGRDNEKEICRRALREFDRFVDKLRDAGVEVVVIEDTEDPKKPDAVFPNNWVTFHRDGSIITYPMFSSMRRAERREEILESITEKFDLAKRYSLEFYEEKGQFLEGTGSMVLDRKYNIVYAALGPRTDVRVLDKFCLLKGYEKVVFHALDRNEAPIYHTNVMMALGDGFVVICMESIRDQEERNRLINALDNSSLEIIEIDFEQMEAFAGNMLQVLTRDGVSLLVMSTRAYESLHEVQIEQISKYTRILHSPLETIETYGGGSARCMLAEIFYPLDGPKK